MTRNGTSTSFTITLQIGTGAIIATWHRNGLGFIAADGTDVDLFGVDLSTLKACSQRAVERAVKTYGMAQYGTRIPSRKIANISAWKTLPEMLQHEHLNRDGITLEEIQAAYTVDQTVAA